MTVDEIMHSADYLIRSVIIFRVCQIGIYHSFEYCYFGECLYLVRHKSTGFMMFVHAQTPESAIETVIDRIKKGRNYEI